MICHIYDLSHNRKLHLQNRETRRHMLMADSGILILRLVVGLYIAAHGAQKLFGWFDGPGLNGTIGAMGGGLGFRPASLWVTVLTLAEVVGGALMVLGFLGPIGPLSVAGA